MWALANAKAGQLLSDEIKEALSAVVVESVPYNSIKGLEVLIWASKRNILDMQDVYLAATNAVRIQAHLLLFAGLYVKLWAG